MIVKKLNASESNVYERLVAVRMSASEREAAIVAMEDGEKIAAAIMSVAHFLRQLVTTPALKPNFKH